MIQMTDVGLVPCSASINDGLAIVFGGFDKFSFASLTKADVTSMDSGMMHALAKWR
jgi:hypothetical protein